MAPSNRLAGLFASLVVLASATASARPQHRPQRAFERWTEVRSGVRHLERRDGPFAYHVVAIDLRTEGLRIESTDEATALPTQVHRGAHRWTRTSTWARRVDADIAINGNYYDLTRWRSACGLAVSEGHRWRSTYDDRRLNCFASAGFGDGGRVSFFDSRRLRKSGDLPAWMQTVVSGSPALVRNGELVHIRHPRHALYRNPRTAIGVDKDGTTLFLLVVDGREGSAQGMTCREAATVLRDLGAHNAINLDGGGSSALYIAQEGGVVNHTGEPERPVVNHLGFFFDDSTTNARSATPPTVAAPGAPARSPSGLTPFAANAAALRRADPMTFVAPAQGHAAAFGSVASLAVAGVVATRRRRSAANPAIDGAR
ncbi:MAG: phosphodiester glycosidase family protein [Myxococcales bacterium]|nr:phosphodiester glycosidase family protein [Myxococcales bacterium]